MQRFDRLSPWLRPPRSAILLAASLGLLMVVAGFADLPDGPASIDQVIRGRVLVLNHDCGGCHNDSTSSDPRDPKWLAGVIREDNFFQIGPFKTARET